MKIHARLPLDRQAEGELWVTDADGLILLGPVRARGEADNAGAMAHGNVQEDPTKAFGDHPGGVYRVTAIVMHPEPVRSYGPAFLRLVPVSGEALEAAEHGRSGFGIHGGDLHPDGRLRETYGCLRVDNEVAERLAALIRPEVALGGLLYECEITT